MSNLNILVDEITKVIEEEEENYDHPNGSVWIIAVGDNGDAYVLKAPNIHWSFFENGRMVADDIGIRGAETLPCGVHEITTSFTTTTCWETGYADGHDFDITESKPLYII